MRPVQISVRSGRRRVLKPRTSIEVLAKLTVSVRLVKFLARYVHSPVGLLGLAVKVVLVGERSVAETPLSTATVAEGVVQQTTKDGQRAAEGSRPTPRYTPETDGVPVWRPAGWKARTVTTASGDVEPTVLWAEGEVDVVIPTSKRVVEGKQPF